MKKLVTLQGKQFRLSNVVLYKIVKDKEGKSSIIAYVHDKEQSAKYRSTKKIEDAPIWVDEYTEETELSILGKMKRISYYIQGIATKEVIVTYDTNEREVFEGELLEDIKENRQKQRKFDEYSKATSDAVLGETESSSKKMNKGVVRAAVAMLVAGALGYGISKFEGCDQNELVATPTAAATSTPTPTIGLPTPTPTTPIIQVTYSFDINDKEELREKAQKLSDSVGIDETQATKVIEVLNSKIPSSMEYLNDETYEKEMNTLLAVIDSIISNDVFNNSQVGIHNYIANSRERALVESAIKESQKYIKTTDFIPSTEVVSDLLSHEYFAIAGSEYVQASNIAKYVTGKTYEFTNKYMPLWAGVENKKSEGTTRIHDLYGLYYFDEETRICYYPEIFEGELVYVYIHEDELDPEGWLIREHYTKEEMEKWLSEDVNLVKRGVFPNVEYNNNALRGDLVAGKTYYDGLNFSQDSSLANAMKK